MLMVEQGFGGGASDAELAFLHVALLMDCSAIASVETHTGGMSLERAERPFETEAFTEPMLAQRFALRGTHDSGYFAHTLGRLTINDLRAKYLAAKFGGSLRAFHDRLLGLGCPAFGFLDRLLQTT